MAKKSSGRIYFRFWKILREKHILQLECLTSDSRRLKKAIIKEKDLDVAFKLEESLAGNFWVLSTEETAAGPGKETPESKVRITFKLSLRNDCVI